VKRGMGICPPNFIPSENIPLLRKFPSKNTKALPGNAILGNMGAKLKF